MRTVLFICTGNTCRSPMAEAIAREALLRDPALAGVRDDVFVASAGVSALDGMPTTIETIEALKSMGIEHDGRSKRLTDQMIRKADLVLCMTDAQRVTAQRLVANLPAEQAKIVRLDPMNDIEDPIGLGRRTYDDLARKLKKIVPARLSELLSASARS